MNIKLLDLDSRQGEPLHFVWTLDPLELKDRHQEIRRLTPVNVSGEAKRAGELYYVSGQMAAEADFACARCLSKFTQPIEVDFAETFAAPQSEQVFDEDDEIVQLSTDEIELEPLLEEHFLLAVPAFPLCAEDCAGLCPSCGINRNEQACSCTTERIDPRLAGLADFFKKEQ